MSDKSDLIRLWAFDLLLENDKGFLLKRNKTCVCFKKNQGYEVFKHIDGCYISSGIRQMSFKELTNLIEKIDGL